MGVQIVGTESSDLATAIAALMRVFRKMKLDGNHGKAVIVGQCIRMLELL